MLLVENYIIGLNHIFFDRDVNHLVLEKIDLPMYLKELEEQGLLKKISSISFKILVMDVFFIVRHIWELTDKRGMLKTGNDLHRELSLMFEDDKMLSVEDVFAKMSDLTTCAHSEYFKISKSDNLPARLSEIIPNEKDRELIKLGIEKNGHYVVVFQNKDGRKILYQCHDAFASNGFFIHRELNYGVPDNKTLRKEIIQYNIPIQNDIYDDQFYLLKLMSLCPETGWKYLRIRNYD